MGNSRSNGGRTRRNRMIGVAIVLAFALLLWNLPHGEGPSRYEELQNAGILGEHQLAQMEPGGSISGSFFLASGSFERTRDITFFWNYQGSELVSTMLPYDRLRFIIDDECNEPVVEFVFKQEWLDHRNDLANDNHFSADELINVNDIIGDGHSWRPLIFARVRLSSKVMEDEVYLPKSLDGSDTIIAPI
ncbi:hypothetical protein ACFL0L_00135 [Patescibacteria group bacterium]